MSSTTSLPDRLRHEVRAQIEEKLPHGERCDEGWTQGVCPRCDLLARLEVTFGFSTSLPSEWGDALALAHNWKGYWEDDPVVHMDTAQVGLLAGSFLFALLELGVIKEPQNV